MPSSGLTAVLFATLAAVAPAARAQEVVSQLQVHGNTLTGNDEVIRLSGLAIGAPVDGEIVAAAAARLRASNHFQHVDVLKRFASIADPTQVILVIIVDEGPVRIEVKRATAEGEGEDGDGGQQVARARRARRLLPMFLPIVDFEDGYGLSYGVRFSVPNPAGSKSRLSFPATWGGEKRAAVELEKTFTRGPVTRIESGASIARRTNPFYREDDDRNRVWIRAEREMVPPLRVGATAAWERQSFAGQHGRFTEAGVDVTFDTRIDPMLPRNAIYARAAWNHLNFDRGASINRTELDGRGYVGLFGQNVLMLRAFRSDADRPLPPYLQPMLGGTQNLRGFRAGMAVGNTLVAGSLELRVPLTSPLNIGKLGVSVFVDAGAAYGDGERLRDQTIERAAGGGVWFSVAVIRLNLAVAHGIGAGTRVHFSTTASF